MKIGDNIFTQETLIKSERNVSYLILHSSILSVLKDRDSAAQDCADK